MQGWILVAIVILILSDLHSGLKIYKLGKGKKKPPKLYIYLECFARTNINNSVAVFAL